MANTTHNFDPTELKKFDHIDWWNPDGEMKLLHRLNPVRMYWMQQFFTFSQQRVLDLGCGGGLLSEAIAKAGSRVTGIDLSSHAIAAARDHQKNTNLDIQYDIQSVSSLALAQPASFDAVVCMEMLEHVPDPEQCLADCAQLLKPQAYLFLSTINRNLKSYLLAILAAEYILRYLPIGTHDYKKLISPASLARYARKQQLSPQIVTGVRYCPVQQQFQLCENVSVNYFMLCRKT